MHVIVCFTWFLYLLSIWWLKTGSTHHLSGTWPTDVFGVHSGLLKLNVPVKGEIFHESAEFWLLLKN